MLETGTNDCPVVPVVDAERPVSCELGSSDPENDVLPSPLPARIEVTEDASSEAFGPSGNEIVLLVSSKLSLATVAGVSSSVMCRSGGL